MLQRCYDQKHLNKNPHYTKVTVCDAWLIFSNFLAWFKDNYKEGWELDKDLLSVFQEVKQYSPSTCIFVPKHINQLLLSKRPSKYKRGVSWVASRNKYRARISHNNKNITLGYYATEDEAYNKYLQAKYKIIAEESKNPKLPEQLRVILSSLVKSYETFTVLVDSTSNG